MAGLSEEPRSRPVVVIGGGGDIGKAIVAAFEALGQDVTSTDRSTLDLSSLSSIEAFLGTRSVPPRDVVFAAATNDPKPFLEADIETVLDAIDVNFTAFLRLVRGLAPGMAAAGGGAITVISSLYASIGRSGRLPYSASKHALLGTVRTLAIEFGPLDIRFNAVSPGFVDTRLTRRNVPPAKLAELRGQIPLGRLGLPQDIADAVVFMHSDKARYITGQNLVVDGGFLAGGFMGV